MLVILDDYISRVKLDFHYIGMSCELCRNAVCNSKSLNEIGERVVQERILKATRGLSQFPDCSNVKRLVDHEPTHRLRVGNWRVPFNVFEAVNIVSIEEVKKRDENTY